MGNGNENECGRPPNWGCARWGGEWRFRRALGASQRSGQPAHPQPAKPELEPEEVKWTDDDLPAAEAEIVDSPATLQVEENSLNEVLLVQPEEQEYRGKAASSEHSGAGEVNDANRETATATNETKGRREVNPETAERRKVNSEEGRRKVNPVDSEGVDDAKSIRDEQRVILVHTDEFLVRLGELEMLKRGTKQLT